MLTVPVGMMDGGSSPLEPSLEVDFTSPPSQSFPATTAEMLAAFASSSSPKMYLLQESSGSLTEAQGGASFTATGSPKYALGTPFSGTKKAAASTGSGHSFTCSNTSTLDPAGGSYTWLVAFRMEQVRSGNTAIFSKYGSGKGIVLNVGADGVLHVLYNDGAQGFTGTNDGLITAAKVYGRGAYHLVAVTHDAGAGTITFRSGEEKIVATPSVWTAANFTTAQAAELFSASGVGQSGDGQVAYLAGFAGTISDGEFAAWVTYGGTSAWTGVTFTPGAGSNMGIGTYDFRDVSFPRVRAHAHSQVPMDGRHGRLGVLSANSKVNYIHNGEDLTEAVRWSTNGSGLVATGRAAPDPGYGYSATSLNKGSAGTTPSRRQSITAVTIEGYVMGSVWLWTTDVGTRKAALRVTFNGDGGGEVKTTTVTLSSVPQLVTVLSSEIVFSAGTSMVFDVFPCDPADNAETGTTYAWGAQLSVEHAGATMPLSYSPYGSTEGSTTPGRLSGTGATTGTKGWMELLASAVGPPPPTVNELLVIDEGGGAGGVALAANPATGSLSVDVYDSASGLLYTQNYWDSSIAYESAGGGRRLHFLPHWSFANDKVRLALQGGVTAGRLDVIETPPAWPGSLATSYRLGADDGNDNYPNVVFERVAFGTTASAYPTTAQLIQRAEDAMGHEIERIAWFGDSITEFFDGPHSKLMRLRNAEYCTVVNHGWSGNYLAESGETDGDLLARVSELAGKSYDDVIVDAGRNDIGIGGFTGAQTLDHLDDVIAAVAPHAGSRVIVNTLTPNKGCEATFPGYWSVTKQGYIETFNAGVLALPSGADIAVDQYTPADDPGNPGAWIDYPTTTYDKLHPTHGISGNPGPGADNMGAVEFADAYGSAPLP